MKHKGHRKCGKYGCTNYGKPTNIKYEKIIFCIKHGGGVRCTIENCKKLAISPYKYRARCKQHGGGKMCKYPGCKSLYVYSSFFKYCRNHTKNKYKCVHPKCKRPAGKSKNGFVLCNNHNYQGEPCTFKNCERPRIDKDVFCIAHTKKICNVSIKNSQNNINIDEFCNFLLDKQFINYYSILSKLDVYE